MTRNYMRSLHDHFKGVPSARRCSPRCKTAQRTHQDQRGQASRLCGVATAHLSMEEAVLYKRRNALECFNAKVSRDFQLEQYYMRGLETMQMWVALSLSVMLAMACTSIRESQPQRIRSLIFPLAA